MIELLNEWSARWVPWFLSAVVQNTLFLILVFVALWLLRHASARVRTIVATIGVVKLVVPPLVPLHWLADRTGTAASETAATLLFPFADTATGQSAPWGGDGGLTGGLYPVSLLMLAWGVVAVARLGWSVLQTVDLARSVRDAESVPASETPSAISEYGLSIKISSRISMPLTIGPWPRCIYVPEVWHDWSPAMRDAVLQHELAHVLRRDGLVQMAEILAQAIFFFHPLVSLLIRRLRSWREMACDDHSVGGDPSVRLAYSRFLVELAESALGPRPATESASTLARRRCELMNRVTYQVKEGPMRNVSKMKLSLVLIVLLAAVVPLSLVYGDAPPPPPPPSSEPGIDGATPAPPSAVTAETPTAAPTAPSTETVKTNQADAPSKTEEQEIKKSRQAKGDTPPPPPPPKATRLTLTVKGTMVNGELMSDTYVKKTLYKLAQATDGDAIIAIECDGGVPMKQIHGLQHVLRDAGLYKVKYMGELGEAVPMILPPDEAKKKLSSLPKDLVMHVKVYPDGVLTVDGKKTKGAHLSNVVAEALLDRPEMVFALHTEQKTTYGAFVQVLQEMKMGGADKIAIQDPGA